MNVFSPSPETFEQLVQHLVNMEEQKRALASGKEKDPLLRGFIGIYVRELDRLVRKAQVSPKGGRNLPFVIVGCEVDIEVLSMRGLYSVRIVEPMDADERAGRISFLSPAGRMLILKRVGDEIGFPVSSGVCRCRIRRIQLAGNSQGENDCHRVNHELPITQQE